MNLGLPVSRCWKSQHVVSQSFFPFLPPSWHGSEKSCSSAWIPQGQGPEGEMLTIQNMRKEESFNFPKAFLRTVETSKGRLTNGKRLLDQLKMGRFSPHGGSS